MKGTFPATVVIALLGTVSLGQSSNSVGPARTFHVRGTVIGPLGDDGVPGATVSFQDEHENKSVVGDSHGSYEVDLPLGLYKMTAQYRYRIGRDLRVPKFVRPLFRVSSPASIVLNAPMFAERLTCDIIVVSQSLEEWEEGQKNLCGGEDFFEAPSSDGVPFQVYIRYPKRSPHLPLYDHSGDQLATNAYTPVLVEYNLFTLTAQHVVYDSKNHTIAASGDVTVMDQTAEAQHTTSITFKLSEGQAVAVP